MQQIEAKTHKPNDLRPKSGTQTEHAVKNNSSIDPPQKINNSNSRIPDIEEILKSFHAEKATHKKEDFSIRSIEYSKSSGTFINRFMSDGNFRSASISGLNAFLHSLTVATAFTPGLKTINEYIDNAAFLCTKIVSPLVSFGISSIFAFVDKKPVEGLIKAIPPLFLPFIGDANVDTVFGLCFGLNQPYDMVSDRLKARAKESSDFASHLQEKNKTSLGNAQLILKEFKNIFSDLVQGKLHWRDISYILNCSMMLAGSLPMLLFASQQRNTAIAKFFGILRNAGGIFGDILFLSQKANFHKLLVGILCSLGGISNITKRLVPNEALARIFIHLGAALDVAGYTVWNAWSDKKD